MSATDSNLSSPYDVAQAGRRWTRYVAWQARQSRLGRIILRLSALLVCLLLLSRGSGGIASVAWVLAVILFFVLAPLLIFLLFQWIRRRVLWKVRNRLIATYLLMGLAPIVLFVTLTGIAAYMFAGQFATNAAIAALDEASYEVRGEAATVAMLSVDKHSTSDPLIFDTATHPSAPDISLAVLHDGNWQPMPFKTAAGSAAAGPFETLPRPAWLHAGFHGIIALNGRLYLCSETRIEESGQNTEVLGSLPLNGHTLRSMAKNLGYISLHPGFNVKTGSKWNEDTKRPRGAISIGADAAAKPAKEFNAGAVSAAAENADATGASATATPAESFPMIGAGDLPAARHFYDTRVLFTAPLPVFSWKSGEQISALVSVVSRPTLLYARLFATSVRIGRVVSISLIAIGLFFGVVEILALILATRLSRTITRSVAELYLGTQEIDRGNLQHRVPVGKHDQLGVLAASFNSMAGSLDTLLEQQREQQRLLSELAIAQEVQKNLFPESPVILQGLELHAVCLPARSVSGDYFDFIFGRGNTLCITLGDISGKGISAALLMASLHSAVRAFSLGAEASSLPRPEPRPAALPDSSLPSLEHCVPPEQHKGPVPSPAHLLELLNHHLYVSTPPEKYATLFLAFYDKRTRRLTYSNGGHLPPFILHADGTTRRLDCGGSVVGLLDGLSYVEDTVDLGPGDLLFAYSDGLTEPENGKEEEYGENRLLEIIRTHRMESLPNLAAITMESLQRWIGDHEQPDDMTLLLARQH